MKNTQARAPEPGDKHGQGSVAIGNFLRGFCAKSESISKPAYCTPLSSYVQVLLHSKP